MQPGTQPEIRPFTIKGIHALILCMLLFITHRAYTANIQMADIGTGTRIMNAQDAYAATKAIIGTLPYEAVITLFVDSHGAIIKTAGTTRGIGTDLYVPWEVWSSRTPKGTSDIYYVHNHPREVPVRLGWAEGDPGNPAYQPSIDYLQLTDADIRYADHWGGIARESGIQWDTLAINRFGYVSYLEEGHGPENKRMLLSSALSDMGLFGFGYPLVQGLTWLSNGIIGTPMTSRLTDLLYGWGSEISG